MPVLFSILTAKNKAMDEKYMCLVGVWDRPNRPFRNQTEETSQESSEGKSERGQSSIDLPEKSRTLAKSFASPPLAAIVKTSCNKRAANPILRLLDISSPALQHNQQPNDLNTIDQTVASCSDYGYHWHQNEKK